MIHSSSSTLLAPSKSQTDKEKQRNSNLIFFIRSKSSRRRESSWFATSWDHWPVLISFCRFRNHLGTSNWERPSTMKEREKKNMGKTKRNKHDQLNSAQMQRNMRKKIRWKQRRGRKWEEGMKRNCPHENKKHETTCSGLAMIVLIVSISSSVSSPALIDNKIENDQWTWTKRSEQANRFEGEMPAFLTIKPAKRLPIPLKQRTRKGDS